MKKINWSSPDIVCKKIVFVDGLARSGKSLVGPIVSSFDKTYPLQHQILIDNLIPLLANNSISKEACKTLVGLFLNQNIYYLNISRCINLRPGDNSSIVKDKNYKIFLKNLRINEGDYIIDKIKKDNFLPIFMSHDLLSYAYCLEKINLNYRIIYVLRNPIDNIYSFYSKYDKRYEKEKYNINNPRFFSLSAKKNKKLLPYYAYTNSNYFLKLNNAEKAAYYYLHSIKKSISSYKKIKNKKSKILLVRFDDMTQDHLKTLNKLSKFLGLKKSKHTNKALKNEKVPRKKDLQIKMKKKDILRKVIRPSIFRQLEKYEASYNKNLLFK